MNKTHLEAQKLISNYQGKLKLNKNLTAPEDEEFDHQDFLNYVSDEHPELKDEFDKNISIANTKIETSLKDKSTKELSDIVLKLFNAPINTYDFNLTSEDTLKDVLDNLILNIKKVAPWEYDERITIKLNSDKELSTKLNFYSEQILNGKLFFAFDIQIDQERFDNKLIYLEKIQFTRLETTNFIQNTIKKIDFSQASWNTDNTENDILIFVQDILDKVNIGIASLENYSLELKYKNKDGIYKLAAADDYHQLFLLHFIDEQIKCTTETINVCYSFNDLKNEVLSFFNKNNPQNLINLYSSNTISETIEKITKKIKELYNRDASRIVISFDSKNSNNLELNDTLMKLVLNDYDVSHNLNILRNNTIFIPVNVTIDNHNTETSLYLQEIKLNSNDHLNLAVEIIAWLNLSELQHWTNEKSNNDILYFLEATLNNLSFASIYSDFKNFVQISVNNGQKLLEVRDDYEIHLTFWDKVKNQYYSGFWITVKAYNKSLNFQDKVLDYLQGKLDLNLKSEDTTEYALEKLTENLKSQFSSYLVDNSLKVSFKYPKPKGEKLAIYANYIHEDNLWYEIILEINDNKYSALLQLTNIPLRSSISNALKDASKYTTIYSNNTIADVRGKILNSDIDFFKKNNLDIYIHSNFYNEKINDNWNNIFNGDVSYKILTSYNNMPINESNQFLYLNSINLSDLDTIKRIKELISNIDFSQESWNTDNTESDILTFINTNLSLSDSGSAILMAYELNIENSQKKLEHSESVYKKVTIKVGDKQDTIETGIFNVMYSSTDLVKKVLLYFNQDNGQDLSLSSSDLHSNVSEKIKQRLKNIFYYEYDKKRIVLSLAKEEDSSKTLNSYKEGNFNIAFNLEIDNKKYDNQTLYLKNINNESQYDLSSVSLKSYYSSFIDVETAKVDFHQKIILETNFILGKEDAIKILKPEDKQETIKKLFDEKTGLFKTKFNEEWNKVNSWVQKYNNWMLKGFLNYWSNQLGIDPNNVANWFHKLWEKQGASFRYKIVFSTKNMKYNYDIFEFYFNNQKIALNTRLPMDDTPFDLNKSSIIFDTNDSNWDEQVYRAKQENELLFDEEKRKEAEERKKRKDEELSDDEKNKTINELIQKNTDLKNENVNLTIQSKNLEAKIKELEDIINTPGEETKELLAELAAKKEELTNLLAQQKKNQEIIEKCNKEIQDIKNTLDKKQKELDEKLKQWNKERQSVLDTIAKIKNLDDTLLGTTIALAAIAAGFLVAGIFFGITMPWWAACSALFGFVSSCWSAINPRTADYIRVAEETVNQSRRASEELRYIDENIPSTSNNLTPQEIEMTNIQADEIISTENRASSAAMSKMARGVEAPLKNTKVLLKPLYWAFFGIEILLGVIDITLWCIKSSLIESLNKQLLEEKNNVTIK